ncbi:MAG: hypothetical protein LBD71_04175 [Treponema sp.]|jgi:hypothetical protein|nr:hypothetical protein [Treponema sp.]
MSSFDVSKQWVLLSPVSFQASVELSRYIDLLRKKSGIFLPPPRVIDASGPAPDDSTPIILLNAGDGGPKRNGYSWRLGKNRGEIYGDSNRGLCNGIFNFLSALGISWPEPDSEKLPAPAEHGAYPLAQDKAYAASAENGRRLIVPSGTKPKKTAAIVRWAARNGCDAIVVSLRDPLPENASLYSLITERGGWDLSLLVPRRYFFFHRDLFRMEEGRRTKQYNFCPTNPRTISLLKMEAAAAFKKGTNPEESVRIWHLWPDRGHEKTWCSCPACRAFTPEEQNRIAVNAAADVLAEIDPEARLSCFPENTEENGANKNPDALEPKLSLRPNVFILKRLPDINGV